MFSSLLKKFIENLNKETEFDKSRRRIIKGVAGLAALAAISPSIVIDGKLFNSLSASEFEYMCSNGVVENMTFYLDRTVKIEDMNGLIIRNCEFIALEGFEGGAMITLTNRANCQLINCYLDCRNVAMSGITYTEGL